MYMTLPTAGIIIGILGTIITVVGRIMQQSIKLAINESVKSLKADFETSMTAMEAKLEAKFTAKEVMAAKLETIRNRAATIKTSDVASFEALGRAFAQVVLTQSAVIQRQGEWTAAVRARIKCEKCNYDDNLKAFVPPVVKEGGKNNK